MPVFWVSVGVVGALTAAGVFIAVQGAGVCVWLRR